MKTNLFVSLIASAVVVVGGGYYLVHSHAGPAGTEEAQGTEQAAQPAATEEPGKFSGSFVDLAARGGSWKCTINTTTGQAISSGVAYVSGAKVRGDFTSSISGYSGSIETHMVTDGQYAYTWSSLMPQGMKIKMSAQSGTTAAAQSTSPNQSYSYDCEPWTVDSAEFTLPTNITFQTPPGQ